LGGLALLGGFVLIGSISGTYEISELFSNPEVIKSSHLYIPALILILIGAFTKSAQFPFHFWLPGAMAAPSPVSAYLHSATMVKAGVFLLARLNPIMGGTEPWFYILSIFGVTTMFVGAYLSITQTDLKRILAYTTVSALGTLVLLLGTSTEYAFNAAIIFLLVHALYKGTLFMMAGTIEKKTGTRDINKLGGLFKYMPFAGVVMVLALVSMAGVPPMLGFLGKELIYEAKANAPAAHWFIVIAGFLTNVILVFLSLRLAIDVFWSKEPSYSKKPIEPSLSLILGPALLVLASLVLGVFPKLLANPLTSQAIAAISPGMSAIELKLWHGFNLVLALSVVTVATGLVAFKNRFRIIRFVDKINLKLFYHEFSKLFFEGIDQFLVITKIKTKTIQHGYHRYYLMTIFIVSSILVWTQIWNSGPVLLELDFSQIPLHLVAIVALTIAATVTAASSSSRVVALIATGIVGFGITLIFLSFSGVDLPVTMVLVETIMVILVTGLLLYLPKFGNYSDTGSRMRDLLVSAMVGLFFVVLVIKGSSLSMGDGVSEFFKLNSLSEAYGRNIVNVILVDFRALDTLGEIAVLAIAAIGIFSLISFTKTKK
jgi:multicomponent Na+:H+ antiporter subunit A